MGLIPPYFSSFILPDRIIAAFGDFPSPNFPFLSRPPVIRKYLLFCLFKWQAAFFNVFHLEPPERGVRAVGRFPCSGSRKCNDKG